MLPDGTERRSGLRRLLQRETNTRAKIATTDMVPSAEEMITAELELISGGKFRSFAARKENPNTYKICV